MITDETKVTLKLGVIVSLISALVLFVLTNLWIHQTDITVLKTNQVMVLQTLVELRTVPTKLGEISIQMQNLDQNLKDHRIAYQDQVRREKAANK